MQILIAALIVSASLLADPPTAEVSTKADLDAYQAARVRVGHDPDKHVALALWCEQHNLKAEAARHLATAIRIDPTNAKARGLLGQVDDSGSWLSPEKVTRRVAENVALVLKLAEYNRRRSTTPRQAEPQWRLGLWCDEEGLTAEAKAHFEMVVRIDPRRDAAWKRLGYKKHNGQWTTDELLAAAKAEAETQKKADKDWTDRLTKWKTDLAKGKPERRAEAERELAEISDPRAVHALMRVFSSTPEGRRRLVRILDQIDGPNASRALVLLALSAPEGTTRGDASKALTLRDPRDFVDLLIAQLKKPVRFEVRPVNGPNTPGELFVEGQKFDVRRIYRPLLQDVQQRPGDEVVVGPDGLPFLVRPSSTVRTTPISSAQAQVQWEQNASLTVFQQRAEEIVGRGDHSPAALARLLAPIDPMSIPSLRQNSPLAMDAALAKESAQSIAAGGRGRWRTWDQEYRTTETISLAQVEQENQRALMNAQQQLDSDVMMIGQYNQGVRRSNDLVLMTLQASTGQALGDNPEAWAAWWTNQQGFVWKSQTSTQRATYSEEYDFQANTTPSLPGVQMLGTSETVGTSSHSCFGAGTPVRTFTGTKPIEQVRAGDRVLSQDTTTGVLAYKPVLVAYHNPPAETFRVDMSEDSVVATGIHRFWKAGKGWVMTRDLKPGDVVRTISGTAKVVSVTPAGKQPVFNLEVSGGSNFFVGQSGALVHDNSNVAATPEPFDAVKGTEGILSPSRR